MKKDVILIGGGGHCLSVIGVVEDSMDYKIAGILDKSKPVGEKVLGYEVVGNDYDIPYWVEKRAVFVIAIGHIGNATLRRKTFDLVKKHGGDLPSIFASTSWVSPHAVIGEGTLVFHKSVVNAKAVIGDNCIINTGSIVEHNTIIGYDNHLSTGVIVNGDCVVGNNNFLGCGALVQHSITIGSDIIIGAGSVVLQDCIESGRYLGVPAKRK